MRTALRAARSALGLESIAPDHSWGSGNAGAPRPCPQQPQPGVASPRPRCPPGPASRPRCCSQLLSPVPQREAGPAPLPGRAFPARGRAMAGAPARLSPQHLQPRALRGERAPEREHQGYPGGNKGSIWCSCCCLMLSQPTGCLQPPSRAGHGTGAGRGDAGAELLHPSLCLPQINPGAAGSPSPSKPPRAGAGPEGTRQGWPSWDMLQVGLSLPRSPGAAAAAFPTAEPGPAQEGSGTGPGE